MWRHDCDRPDDPQTRERETQRLARDEYDRPRYGNPPSYSHAPAQQAHWRGAENYAPSGHASGGRAPNVEELRVHELMTRRVASVHPATSVERAARLMEECDC